MDGNSQGRLVSDGCASVCDTPNPHNSGRNLLPNRGECLTATEVAATDSNAPRMVPEGGCPTKTTPNQRQTGTGPTVIASLKGYPAMQQHPFYFTSSRELGLRPSTCNLPVRYFPRNNSFTLSVQGIGNYMDSHFTTCPDRCQHMDL